MDVIIYLILILRTVWAQTYTEMDNLFENLFNTSRYNKLLRPLQNQSHVIQVNLTQYLTAIEFFDITSGELLVSGFFEIAWRDELLTWEPVLFGGKRVIPLPKAIVWKPEISLMSASVSENEGSLIDYSGFASAWVDNQGFVIVIPAGSYRTRCTIDTSLFPFDKHTCYFQFYVSNHDISELMLYSPTGNLDTKYFTQNGEWMLQDTKSVIVVVEEENIENLSVAMMETSFTLTRRSAFEIINTYSPIMFMTTLNLLTCFIRPDCGERLTFAVTLYLALTFTLTACIERFPNNSLNIPLIMYGFLTANLTNTAGVCWSICIVRLASRQRGAYVQLPRLVRYIVMKCRKKSHSGSNRIATVNTTKSVVESPGKEEDFSDSMREHEKDEESVDGISGIEVANALDKMYFVLISIVICVLNIFFYLITVVN